MSTIPMAEVADLFTAQTGQQLRDERFELVLGDLRIRGGYRIEGLDGGPYTHWVAYGPDGRHSTGPKLIGTPPQTVVDWLRAVVDAWTPRDLVVCKHCGQEIFEDGTDEPEDDSEPKVIFTHLDSGDVWCDRDEEQLVAGEPA